MSERGFTILELLLAVALLGIVMFGVGAFYFATARVDHDNTAQTFLQRQATLIFDEMTKQIGEATISTDPSSLLIPCPGGVADSLQVKNSRGTYCFHRDGAGTGVFQTSPGGGEWDLLKGPPAKLTTTTGACPAAGGFCPTILATNGGVTVGAAITLRLRFQLPGTTGYQTMTFNTTIAARN
jgi:prepilin-type N-terminal cleavage/methylation domain-containing protein